MRYCTATWEGGACEREALPTLVTTPLCLGHYQQQRRRGGPRYTPLAPPVGFRGKGELAQLVVRVPKRTAAACMALAKAKGTTVSGVVAEALAEHLRRVIAQEGEQRKRLSVDYWEAELPQLQEQVENSEYWNTFEVEKRAVTLAAWASLLRERASTLEASEGARLRAVADGLERLSAQLTSRFER